MAKKLKPPHLLLASNNPYLLRANVLHLISKPSIRALDKEVERNIIALFKLGTYHFDFAKGLPSADWRQKISRMYYGAYNVKRAVDLKVDGHFSTESGDHKNIENLPDTFPKRSTYSNQLKALREDRNLCDYSHDSVEADLAIKVVDAETLVQDFISDVRIFLRALGVTV